MKYVYVIVELADTEKDGAYPIAFSNFRDAINAVKIRHNWKNRDENGDEREEDEVEVSEGHKRGQKPGDKTIRGDPSITELYIEKDIYITIYKLRVKSSVSQRLHTLGGKTRKVRN
jgi:hypothetical protein